jgi:hypothetical protein
MNFISFSVFVILILVVGILEQKERPTRYLKVIFIGLLFLRMHIIFANHVKNAKEQIISLIRIFYIILAVDYWPLRNFLVSEIFMFGVLILWVHFLLLHS